MSASQKEPKKAKTRYEGELTANSKRNRPASYYKLSEKDHATIKAGLIHFVSVYQIAAKIGCGYTTLKQYIAKHNIETVDLGVPVIAMHAPYEIISKADLYTAHQAFEAFFKA